MGHSLLSGRTLRHNLAFSRLKVKRKQDVRATEHVSGIQLRVCGILRDIQHENKGSILTSEYTLYKM